MLKLWVSGNMLQTKLLNSKFRENKRFNYVEYILLFARLIIGADENIALEYQIS